MSAELRRRRKPAVAAALRDPSNRNHLPAAPRIVTRRKMERHWYLLAIFLYVPILVFVNPTTLLTYYQRIVPRAPCQGICKVQSSNTTCGPIDTDRVVFLRIPKTASSTILKLFQLFSETKASSMVDLGELEDIVSSIPVESGATPAGYHMEQLFPDRMRKFYRRAARTILNPPFTKQDRTLFVGHFYFLNWSLEMSWLVKPSFLDRFLPTIIQELYNVKRPPKAVINKIKTITMLRKPQDRLASMYYYDRHDARGSQWRNHFVAVFGNDTLQECLLNETCVKTNNLKRWCNIQVEMICGQVCAKKEVTEKSLEIAKNRIKTDISFTGLVERMNMSLLMLEQLFPTYLEGLSQLETIPRERTFHVSRRETVYSAEAQAVLDEICRFDDQLYEFASELLSERVKTCTTISMETND